MPFLVQPISVCGSTSVTHILLSKSAKWRFPAGFLNLLLLFGCKNGLVFPALEFLTSLVGGGQCRGQLGSEAPRGRDLP